MDLRCEVNKLFVFFDYTKLAMKFRWIFLALVLVSFISYQVKDSLFSTTLSSDLLERDTITNRQNLTRFFDKISKLRANQDSTISIIHIGDSHIEMGHLSGEVEKTLKEEFGATGNEWYFPYHLFQPRSERYLPVDTIMNWKRTTIKQPVDSIPLGVNGLAFYPTSKNSGLHFKKNWRVKSFSSISILHHSIDEQIVKDVADAVISSEKVAEHTTITRIQFKAPVTDIQLFFKRVPIYALNINGEQKSGVTYHRFGVAGATLQEFIANTPYFKEQYTALHPDVLLISLGTNDSYRSFVKEEELYAQLSNFIQKLQPIFPSTTILLSTAPDTRYNSMKPPKIEAVNNAIRKVSNTIGVPCWDLYHIMGGDASLEQWEGNKLVQSDRLHFTTEGYRLQGNLLAYALIKETVKDSKNKRITEKIKQKINNY
jgi:lysophospholipase L1-like esterase